MHISLPHSHSNNRLRPMVVVAMVAALVTSVLAASPALGAGSVLLAGFEDSEPAGITHSDTDNDEFSSSTDFASEGSRSMRFDIAASTSGSTAYPMIWLAEGTALADHDWTAHEWLQVGVVNADATGAALYVVVRDREGNYHQSELAAGPYDYRVFDIDIDAIAEAGVDLSNLEHIQISTPRSSASRSLLVDNIRLADQPVDEAAEQGAVIDQLAELADVPVALTEVDRQLRRAQGALGSPGHDAHAPMQAQIDALTEKSEELGDQLSDIDTTAGLRELMEGVDQLGQQAARMLQISTVRLSNPRPMFGLDTADSMGLVYPRDVPWQSTGESPSLGMVRGEQEHLQTVVVPYGVELSDVQAEVLEISGPEGDGPDGSGSGAGLSVDLNPIGSLYTEPTGAYGRPTYTGWTPDPIRDDLNSVDIPAGDIQPWLVSVESDQDAVPGDYQVTIEVSAEDEPSQQLDIDVQVWPIEIQEGSELSIAFQFTPWLMWDVYEATDPEEKQELLVQYWDFLDEHRIQPDQIYTTVENPADVGGFLPQPVEHIAQIHDRYGVEQFTAMYLNAGELDPESPETWDEQIDSWLDQIGAAMADYEEVGLADEAVVYGFDEATGPMLDAARYTFTRVKERFPDLPIMTTLRDDSLGVDTELEGLVDIWVPWIEGWTPEAAERARDRGDEVWWYHAISTHYPQPNWFNGYPPIDSRMLMGPMSHQAGVDGILYYATNRWVVADRGDQLLVEDDILSDWNPHTFDGTAGDGSLYYPGPEGPMSSLRLENVRDGIEDYNLMQVLRRALADSDAPTEVRERAEEALGAEAIVRHSRDFSEDPRAYREWREEVAEVIGLLDGS